MSKEELEYYNSLSRYEKISYTLQHKSKEEKEEAERKRQESISNWSDDYKKDVRNRIAESKKNRSEEEKEASLQKFRNTISNRTKEESDQIKEKIANGVHRYFENLSDEDRKKFSDTMSKAYHNLTDEQKVLRVQKGIQTKKERYGNSYNPMFNDESKAKLVETNMNKYGVPYFCMTQKCRGALGGNSSLSGPNLAFKELLEKNNISCLSSEFPIGRYSYDFRINENTLVEINPTVTHNSTFSPFNTPKEKDYHFNKTKLATDNGYRCISVWDWDNLDAVINLLSPSLSIGARECVVKEVSSSESENFLNKYHVQGTAKSKIQIGLFYNNSLVSLMTFGKPRYNKGYEYELIRYCSCMKISGGAEKLFQFFVSSYNPTSVISYCDLSKFNGLVYNKLGFNKINVSVGKHWYNVETGKHITDNLLRQRGFDQLFHTNYGKGTSNEELMLLNGFLEVYDCGQATYVWGK